ncbi:MAG: hypothetical protein BM563_12075 [Bacteroidetes bacterium MedPE-SWsnd-G1]|nr:MAG: hypothetical protein BM563_12075 [Bacteroidetes bacterium MedPE-SWsnd-G1]
MISPKEILTRYWGFSTFRAPQEAIINSVLNQKDTIALLPTGGGKSICFQIPTLVQDGLCLVVSPLIALMNDQVQQLKDRNIKALALTSKILQNELPTIFDNLQFGNYKFLYISPEKLQTSIVQERIRNLNIQLIAVDEAHCISEWGHDFRPSYLQIHKLRDHFPKIPIIALTGSATTKVLEDISVQLKLNEPDIYRKSFARDNLVFRVVEAEDKLFKVEQVLKRTNGVTIIYVNTRRKTIELSNQLNTLGYTSTYYHGGLLYDEKIKQFENWFTEKTPIIVATNAFGMGIDKPNVRVVIHYDVPNSIENYMQEAGRAGRDGKKAYSVILKNDSDIYQTKERFQKSIPTIDFIKKVYFQLNQFYHIAYGELQEETFDFNLSEFCNLYKFPVVLTYNVLKTLHKDGIILLDENFDRKSTIHFIGTNKQVFDYYERKPSFEKLIKLILRTYGGVFEGPKPINLNYIAKTIGMPFSTLIGQLKQFEKDEIIAFYHANSNAQIRFLVPREDNRTINPFSRGIEKRNNLKLHKMKALIDFLQNDTICRNIQLLHYFNETNLEKCGHCDVCQESNKKPNVSAENIPNLILTILTQKEEVSSKELVLQINAKEQDVIFSLQLLVEKNRIGLTSQNKFRILE